MSGKNRTKKLNCWEYMGCGKGNSGEKINGSPVCPAAADKGLDMTHGGRQGGRACWVVPDTLCNGNGRGGFTSKFKHCRKCTFYIKVRIEEGMNFMQPTVLLNRRDQGSESAAGNGQSEE